MPLSILVSYLRADRIFYCRHSFVTRPGTQQILKLNERRRIEIHELLNKIRLVVEGMDISEDKRDSIMKRIAKLQQEVDLSKTTMQMLSSCGWRNTHGRPLVRYAERLLRAYAGATEDNQRAALPKPIAQITGPSESATKFLIGMVPLYSARIGDLNAGDFVRTRE